MEAQAAGRAVVAYGAGGALDTVLDGETGACSSSRRRRRWPRRCADWKGLTSIPGRSRRTRADSTERCSDRSYARSSSKRTAATSSATSGRSRAPDGAAGVPAFGAAALALLALALRLPFGTRTLYSYDSANYAFALRDYYNVAHHHPHPQGYPLYVAAAKLIDLVVRQPNTSLVLLSMLAAAGAVALTYLLGRALFGARVGLVAGLLLAFSVGFWGYSEVAYPYTSLAFWLVAGAALCHAALQGRRGLALPLGLALGAAAGFRWDAVVFLAPLWGWALLAVGWRERVLSVAAFLLVCLAWFIPMAALSGGLDGYLEALRLQSEYIVGTYSPLEGGGRAILELNLAYLLTFMRQSTGEPAAGPVRHRPGVHAAPPGDGLPSALPAGLATAGAAGVPAGPHRRAWLVLSLAPVLAILVGLVLAELDGETAAGGGRAVGALALAPAATRHDASAPP